MDQLLPGLAAQGNGHGKGVLANPGFDDEVATEAAVTVQEEEAPAPSIFTFPKGRVPAPCSTACSRPSTSSTRGRVAGTAHRRPADPGGVRRRLGPVLQQQVEAVLDTSLETGLGDPVRLRDLAPSANRWSWSSSCPWGG